MVSHLITARRSPDDACTTRRPAGATRQEAKGIASAKLNGAINDALAAMRAHASTHDLTRSEVAQGLIDCTIRLR
jgi:hypothetical protein